MRDSEGKVVWDILSHRCSSTAEPTPAVRTAAVRGLGTLAMGTAVLVRQGGIAQP